MKISPDSHINLHQPFELTIPQQILIYHKQTKQQSMKSKDYSSRRYHSPSSPSPPLNVKEVHEHYINAIFMGTKKQNRKIGYGIVLFDNDLCALTNYDKNQQYHGQNMFFSHRRIILVQYNHGKIIEAVMRIDGFLLSCKYNEKQRLDGKSFLVDYINNKIFALNYNDGFLKDKTQYKQEILKKKVFQENNAIDLVGEKHAQVLSFNVANKGKISSFKIGNKLQICFAKNGFPDGLGFTFLIRGTHGGFNPEINKNEDPFQFKFLEKGSFKNNHMNQFGKKIFKNGNIYIGGFQNDKFEGQGLLKNITKKNWVFGKFSKGELADMVDFNNEGKIQKCEFYVHKMHENQKKFINGYFQETDFSFLNEILEKSIASQELSLEKSYEERKKDTLRMIQNQFFKNNDEQKKKSPSKENVQVQSVKRIHNFVSQIQTTKRKYSSPIKTESYQRESEKSNDEVQQLKRKKIFQHISQIPKKQSFQRDSFIKLHKINSHIDEKKRKKTQIFSNTPDKPIDSPKSKPKRRSGERKSPIFQSSIGKGSSTLKQKITPRSKDSKQVKISRTNESLVHWNSIRKQMIEKKQSIRKSPRKGKIFETEKKTSNSPKRFNYTFSEDD